MGVGHGFECGECLRRNDKQGLGGIEVADGFDHVSSVDVGNKPECHGAVAIVLERLVRHNRSKVGTSNPDIDDISDRFPGVALPGAAPDAIGEVGHFVEDSMDLGNDVLAIYDDGSAAGCAQGDVEYGSIFGDVDLFTAEHRVDARSQLSLLSEANQQVECFGGNPILGIVHINACGIQGHALTALRVVPEEIAKVEVADSLMVSRKGLPGSGLAERRQSWNHESLSFPFPLVIGERDGSIDEVQCSNFRVQSSNFSLRLATCSLKAEL